MKGGKGEERAHRELVRKEVFLIFNVQREKKKKRKGQDVRHLL